MTDIQRLAAKLDATMHVAALLLANQLDGRQAGDAAAACDMLSRTIAFPPETATNAVRAERRTIMLDTIDAIGERALSMARLEA